MISAIMGFPKGAPPVQEIILTVIAQGNTYAYVDSINPVGASVIPGAPPAVGVEGQLVTITESSEDGVYFKAVLSIIGPDWYVPAFLPFSRIVVRDSVIFNTTELSTLGPIQNGYRFETQYTTKRMLLAGLNKIRFDPY